LIKDSFIVLGDTERLNFSESMKQAFENNLETYEIFSIIEEAFYGKVLKLENIFGLYAKDTDDLVDLFKKFYEGKIEDVEIPIDTYSDDDSTQALKVNFNTIEDFIILLKTVGNPDKIFNVITMEEPFPIPLSVIKSLNQRTIIDPVINAKIISKQDPIFQLNKIGRNANVIDKL
jgi:hypothetical protein